MPSFHLLTPDAQYPDDGLVERETAGPGVDWTILRARKAADLPADVLANCDAIVSWHEIKVDRALITALRKCRIIVRAGVGFDQIDHEAAAAASIPVCNTPDYGTSE